MLEIDGQSKKEGRFLSSIPSQPGHLVCTYRRSDQFPSKKKAPDLLLQPMINLVTGILTEILAMLTCA